MAGSEFNRLKSQKGLISHFTNSFEKSALESSVKSSCRRHCKFCSIRQQHCFNRKMNYFKTLEKYLFLLDLPAFAL